ncbi:TetR/AcrR family transcriptional regulator [Streptomyces sp. NPDC020792]|uniref:TetR/AcrR family transcriptional regulator n=1 Tax=Streptomyces sp. NPDC020792 TaxID=3365089 RepID=UPI003791DB3D
MVELDALDHDHGRRGRRLTAAREVFAEQGFGASSLEHVAQRARVSRGTVYPHFADKRELLLALLATIDADYDEVYAEVGERASAQELAAFFGRMLEEPSWAPVFGLAREAAALDPRVGAWVTGHQGAHARGPRDGCPAAVSGCARRAGVVSLVVQHRCVMPTGALSSR